MVCPSIRTLAAMLTAAAVLLLSADTVGAKEMPFPTGRSVIMRDAGPYVVRGTMTIPRGVQITIQQGARIEGRGGSAELVVEGSLVVRGTLGREVRIKDLRIVLAQSFGPVRLDTTNLEKTTIETAPAVPAEGKLQIEKVSMNRSSRLAVRMCGGHVAIFGSSMVTKAVIEGVPRAEGKPCRLKVGISGCRERPMWDGFRGGLLVKGALEVGVSTSRLGGTLVRFEDNGKLVLAGLKVDASRLEIVHRDARALRGTKIEKCDFYGKSLAFLCPRDERGRTRILLDRCWFRHGADAKTIRAGFVRDAEDDDECGAVVLFKKIKDEPLKLGVSSL